MRENPMKTIRKSVGNQVLRELNCSQLSELFSDFSAQPVAAASLGQVERVERVPTGRRDRWDR